MPRFARYTVECRKLNLNQHLEKHLVIFIGNQMYTYGDNGYAVLNATINGKLTKIFILKN